MDSNSSPFSFFSSSASPVIFPSSSSSLVAMHQATTLAGVPVGSSATKRKLNFVSETIRRYKRSQAKLSHEPSYCCMVKSFMTDQHGSLATVKYLKKCSYQQKIKIASCFLEDKQRMMQVAKDEFGVNCVKELIATVKTTELLPFVTSALREELYELMNDPIGSRLVMFCLEELSYLKNMFIFDAAEEYCLKLANNEPGHVLIEKCIASSNGCIQWRILKKIIKNSFLLAKNSKGNLVIQFALTLGHHKFNNEICRGFSVHLEELSLDQYGSYVLEKCFKSTGREFLLRELVQFDRSTLERIVTDGFGNFVLQTAIKESKGTVYHNQLVGFIRELSWELENNVYASKVVRVVEGLV